MATPQSAGSEAPSVSTALLSATVDAERRAPSTGPGSGTVASANGGTGTPPAATPSANTLPARTPRSGTRLALATWNLEWLDADVGTGVHPRKAEDYARLRAYARRMDADLIAVQEVEGEAALAHVYPEAEYEHYVVPGNDPQRVGFAWKKGLGVVPGPALDDLGLGHLRAGAEVEVRFGQSALRVLNVHLKSGCASAELEGSAKACRKLLAQLPRLERWIDERAAEGTPCAVLGDFNRYFFDRPNEAAWSSLDDHDPAGLDLWSATEGQLARCWNGARSGFLDHLVFDSKARAMVLPGSFEEHLFDAEDARFREVLSDHCPLSVVLEAPGSSLPPAARAPLPANSRGTLSGEQQPPPLIKGNIARGRRLYHLPSCPSYASVVVDESAGERTFATEAEARSAGFVKAGNCP